MGNCPQCPILTFNMQLLYQHVPVFFPVTKTEKPIRWEQIEQCAALIDELRFTSLRKYHRDHVSEVFLDHLMKQLIVSIKTVTFFGNVQQYTPHNASPIRINLTTTNYTFIWLCYLYERRGRSNEQIF